MPVATWKRLHVETVSFGSTIALSEDGNKSFELATVEPFSRRHEKEAVLGAGVDRELLCADEVEINSQDWRKSGASVGWERSF